jgi:hypothetical protein
MKPSELRIGNLLRDELTKTELRVTGLKVDGVLTHVIDRSKFPLPDGWSIEPIPVTEDMLIRFGFEINRRTKEGNPIWRCLSEDGFFEVEQIGDGFFLDDNQSYGTQIDWVHQLQNLFFALTRDELKQEEK